MAERKRTRQPVDEEANFIGEVLEGTEVAASPPEPVEEEKPIKKLAKQVRKRIAIEKQQMLPSNLFFPTGSTTLNLALSDKSDGGFSQGKITNLIGDSSSGKTFLAITAFAEMAQRPEFDEYRLIYDDAENAMEIDMEKFLGKKAFSRIEPPFHTDMGSWGRSNTVEDFYANILRAIRDGRPFFYVLDSFDAISSQDDEDRADNYMKGKDMKGTYGMGKPKLASEMLRVLAGRLLDTKSHLLIISQTRDKIGVTFGEKKTRAGGRALRFYSTHEIWLAVESKIKNTEFKRDIGSKVIAKVKKNKITGKSRSCSFPIFYDYGLDDITSCVEFLITEGVWNKEKGGKLSIPDWDFFGYQKELIRWVEDNNMEDELKALTGGIWAEIEEALRLKRKSRYE